MNIKKWFADWRRGYREEDWLSLKAKWESASMPGQIIQLTPGEYRAMVGGPSIPVAARKVEERCCGNCRFHGPGYYGDGIACHRHAPVIVTRQREDSSGKSVAETRWPPVGYSEVCGDWSGLHPSME